MTGSHIEKSIVEAHGGGLRIIKMSKELHSPLVCQLSTNDCIIALNRIGMLFAEIFTC
jgi:hypothetical protein